MADPQWYTKQGPDGKWYKTQASSPQEATQKLLRAISPQQPVTPKPTDQIGVYRPTLDQRITDLKTDFERYVDKGFAQGAAENLPMASVPEGLLKIARGLAKGGEGKPWDAAKDVFGGALKVGEIPLSFMAPEKAAGQRGVQGLEEAARKITDAVNPAVKDMGSFQKNIGEHLDKIITFAAQKGIKLDSLENLGTAMKEAADSIRSHYYEKILTPFKDVQVSVPEVKGYSGEVSSPSTATLSQLDARLSQINAELYSRYAKTGEAASRAAVKSEAELNSEAAAIRTALYNKLGEVSGLGKEVVAKTRQSFGSLEKLAETTTKSAMEARSAANTAAREPLTINPLSSKKSFIADKAINKLRGDPVKNAVREAMSRADVKPYELPKPNPAAAAKAVRSAPIRGGSTAVGKVSMPTAEEVDELAQKLEARKSRVLASRNKTLRRPLWEKRDTPQGSVGP